MKIHTINEFNGGWYIGHFDPAVLKTNDFEVGYKFHPKGERWPAHYHRVATEYNFLFQGKMVIQNIELNAGDIFIIEPNEVADPVFLEDCHVMVVKVPSVPMDKYNI